MRFSIGMPGDAFRRALASHRERLAARKAEGKDLDVHPERMGYAMVLGAKREGEVYAGTVSPAERARRRAKNKRARVARRHNRRK